MNRIGGVFGFLVSAIFLIAFNVGSLFPAAAGRDAAGPGLGLQLDDTDTPTPSPTSTSTPTFTPTPVTGLTFNGWSYGCTSGPYITCSAGVTSSHTDPYRWDFDITFTYGDNRTNFGSNFSVTLEFLTGVFNTDVPIWWNMYPLQNEVMPNRTIDVQYILTPDLPSMSYPSGNWTIQEQPSPYQKFWVKFTRVTTAPQILVRTDKWHLTLATYPNVATPTNTPTKTSTPTLTNTPTKTNTPTTPTPRSNGIGVCWESAQSWPSYSMPYRIDANIPTSWIDSIDNAANTWTNVSPSPFSFVKTVQTTFTVSLGPIIQEGTPAYTHILSIGDTLTDLSTVFNDQETFDTAIPPMPGSFSVQNLATHEFGHWLSLEDIWEISCEQVTMHAGISRGETKDITLETADEEAINWQYP